MALAEMDVDKGVALARRLDQIVGNNEDRLLGERMALALSDHKPNAATVTGALLAYSGNDHTDDKTRAGVRMMLLAYRDQLLFEEQRASQAKLAASTDILSRRVLAATWVGVVIAAVGVIAAFVSLIKS